MRCLVLLTGLLAAGFASPASPQDVDVTALQLKACTLINDDMARVGCYDHAMSRPASKPAMVDIGGAPQLVVIPQTPASIPPAQTTNPQFVTIPQAPASVPQAQPATPQLSTVSPQLSAAPKSNPVPETPTAAKSERPNTFGMSTIMQAITPSAVTALTQPDSNANGNWQVKADNAALQQASRLIGTLTSADEKTTLVLQCQAGGTQASLSTRSFLGWETLRVLYRLNGNPPIERQWPISPDGKGVIASNPIEFINSLPEGGTLDVRLVDHNENSHDLKFNLGAISNLRSQIATVCRWPGTIVEEKVVSDQKLPTQRSGNQNTPTRPGPPLQLH